MFCKGPYVENHLEHYNEWCHGSKCNRSNINSSIGPERQAALERRSLLTLSGSGAEQVSDKCQC